jgi:hypothetical protein
MLTVLSEAGRSKHGDMKFVCLCDCGSKSVVLRANLLKGNSTNCGCKRKVSSAIRMATLNARHKQTGTKIWRTWKGVVERTTKPGSEAYCRYGGAGIGLFDDWLVFENFAAYMGEPPTPKHSIDRIDGGKGYFPGNVRWATAKEQAHNRKTNVVVSVGGKQMILSDAAKHFGVSKSTASRWFKAGKLKMVETA